MIGPSSQINDTLCVVHHCSNKKEQEEYSLVLEAAGIAYQFQSNSDGTSSILTDYAHAQRAHEELSLFIEENRNWPAPNTIQAEKSLHFKAMAPFIVLSLIFFYGLSGPWHDHSIFFQVGAGDSSKILSDGELFRLITALTLHADLVHLTSNCCIALLLLHFFFQLSGNGIGLFALLLSSTAANYANVWLRGPEHLFVGFSTAIFAVIGMLCTISFSGKSRNKKLHFFMPVMAGLTLLAFLGSEGAHTDITAHFFGLVSGLVSGNFVRLPSFSSLRHNFKLQTTLTLVSISVICGSWYLAFS